MKTFETPELKTLIFASKDILTASAEEEKSIRNELTWIEKDVSER